MMAFIRRLLRLDRHPSKEERDRSDALRSAERAHQLARRLKARRHEMTLRVEVRGRR